MKIAIVTSLNRKLYEYYAHRFYKTYNWPFDCYIYHEGWIPEIDPERNIFHRDIHDTNPTLKDFIKRNETRNEFSTIKGTDNSKIVYGLDFLKDAIRFSYKVFAKTHLMLEGNYDYVFWADADIVFKKPIIPPKITAINKNGTNLQASLNSGPNRMLDICLINIIKNEHPITNAKL